MIQSRRLFAAVALACLMLGGCEKKVAEGKNATGEVLEGTIGDAMIATDQTRSEPPLAPHTAKAVGEKGEKAKGKAGNAPDAEEAPVPVARPSPDAAPAPKPTASEPAG